MEKREEIQSGKQVEATPEDEEMVDEERFVSGSKIPEDIQDLVREIDEEH